jgi:hypothetical protein
MGRRYFKGIHPNDKEFPDHQKRIDWQNVKWYNNVWVKKWWHL